jgi:hypothetical protein
LFCFVSVLFCFVLFCFVLFTCSSRLSTCLAQNPATAAFMKPSPRSACGTSELPRDSLALLLDVC